MARIWKIDVVIFNQGASVAVDLQALGECDYLSSLPLVTLDAQTTEAANAVDTLKVFPCLLPEN